VDARPVGAWPVARRVTAGVDVITGRAQGPQPSRLALTAVGTGDDGDRAVHAQCADQRAHRQGELLDAPAEVPRDQLATHPEQRAPPGPHLEPVGRGVLVKSRTAGARSAAVNPGPSKADMSAKPGLRTIRRDRSTDPGGLGRDPSIANDRATRASTAQPRLLAREIDFPPDRPPPRPSQQINTAGHRHRLQTHNLDEPTPNNALLCCAVIAPET
jgi:hypothetical protein